MKMIFDKDVWLNDMISVAECEAEIETYKASYNDPESWVNDCHGVEVDLDNELMIGATGKIYIPHPDWCKEIEIQN